jgi:hypothetical protein
MDDNFQIGGAKAYNKALREHYHAELDKLRAQHKSAKTEAERLEIERQIERVNENYRKKSASPRCLF